MWLLRLHFVISVLCFITFIGFYKVFKEQIKENGYASSEKKKSIFSLLAFFVPLLNILLVITLFVMISVPKQELDKHKEEREKEKESRQ